MYRCNAQAAGLGTQPLTVCCMKVVSRSSAPLTAKIVNCQWAARIGDSFTQEREASRKQAGKQAAAADAAAAVERQRAASLKKELALQRTATAGALSTIK